LLEVFFTVDVEVWCDGWQDIDRKFPAAFNRYILGPKGQFGLPFQLRMLSETGLKATCFVECLFAGRFGLEPLAEIVEIVQGFGHETQVHLHTEWVDEALSPVVDVPGGKRQHLRHFGLEDQDRLIAAGIRLLERAGATRPTGFRAGSFGFNRDTLTALERNGIAIDSSYNAAALGRTSGVFSGEVVIQPRQVGQVVELPMTVFFDGRRYRHTQLTACSWRELEALLWQALELELGTFVILSHNFELLTRDQLKVDPVVVDRLDRLCTFLSRNTDCFRVRGLRDGPITPAHGLSKRLTSPLWRTALRIAEQAFRRRFA
jgi:hypothetical protein